MTFSLLHESLQNALKTNHIASPTEIQDQTIPKVLQQHSVLAVAKTGQGKTLAFALPILNALIASKASFFALVIAPTRELAVQIGEVFERFGAEIGLKTAVLIGGVDMSVQQVRLGLRPHVVVGTPGRVLDHFANSRGINFKNFRFLVLDECDKLLDMDFESDILAISRKLSKTRQNLLFTATYSKKVKNLQAQTSQNALVINTSQDEQKTNQNLIQFLISTPLSEKFYTLIPLLLEFNAKTIIFCNKISDVSKVFQVLKALNFGVCELHGQMQQKLRSASLQAFSADSTQILVATDVAGRGIDVSDVQLVVNFEVPPKAQEYVHRVGRAGRAGRSGVCVTFVSQAEIAVFQEIEKNVGVRMTKKVVSRELIEEWRERVRGAERGVDKCVAGRKSGEKADLR
ncbi:ATP-dependent rRNA helicase RRP3 [Spironucleus salmonicida]|uniref:ATP-dependent rRNA helicase RRP3 n=1 Tax=Spironucleus salmonicida TaxID=348837 RepID=V6LTT8_9EUKA|nr:ATP-dependent rRNA helicase RRP3 [Spironucleus salmonicida]|eukprot:EST47126.1 ATP-dependent rRNA helicase RRP3 [Spironucleus salmonicida]